MEVLDEALYPNLSLVWPRDKEMYKPLGAPTMHICIWGICTSLLSLFSHSPELISNNYWEEFAHVLEMSAFKSSQGRRRNTGSWSLTSFIPPLLPLLALVLLPFPSSWHVSYFGLLLSRDKCQITWCSIFIRSTLTGRAYSIKAS